MSTPRQFSGTSFSKSHLGTALSQAMERAAAAFLPFGNEPPSPAPGDVVLWVTRDTGDPLLDGVLMVKWTDQNGLVSSLPIGGSPGSDVNLLYPAFVQDGRQPSLPAAPDGMQGWTIKPTTSQPGRLIFGVDNRPIGAGYGVAAVRFSVKVKLTEAASYEIDLGYVDVPAAGFDLASVPTFEIDSFLPGVKLDMTQCAEVTVRIQSLGVATKTSVAVLCGAPADVTWSGVVGPG